MKRECEHNSTNSWWEYDGRGIPLARVCDTCKKQVLARYRPEVLNDANYSADEDIEPDDWDEALSYYINAW